MENMIVLWNEKKTPSSCCCSRYLFFMTLPFPTLALAFDLHSQCFLSPFHRKSLTHPQPVRRRVCLPVFCHYCELIAQPCRKPRHHKTITRDGEGERESERWRKRKNLHLTENQTLSPTLQGLAFTLSFSLSRKLSFVHSASQSVMQSVIQQVQIDAFKEIKNKIPRTHIQSAIALPSFPFSACSVQWMHQ